MSFIFNVLCLIHVTTAAEFNLNSSNATNKSLDTFNQSKITLNNTWDYGDDDPIMRHTLQAKAKEIGKLLLNTATATKRFAIKYLTNQESLKAANTVEQPKNNNHNRYRNSNHFYHFLTAIKFNKRNNGNNYDNFKCNNELKTITSTSTSTSAYETPNDAKEMPTYEVHVKEYPAVLQINQQQKDDDEEEEEEEEGKTNNKKYSHQMKYQTKYYMTAANSFGQMPQFPLQTQQLQLHLHQQRQQPATTAATTTATVSMTTAALLPQKYHHLADYRLLFNAEHHTQFYLHTSTAAAAAAAAANDFVTVATKQATAIATAAFKSFQQPDAHNSRYQDDYNDNDKTSNNEYAKQLYDDVAASVAADSTGSSSSSANDWYENNEMQLLNSTTNGRALNILTDTIGAVFGVTSRPVAATQHLQTEAIELFNGLSLRQSRFNPFNPCRILIHGWLGGSTAAMYNTLVPEYLKLQQGVYNVFTVDWGSGAMADYITASYRVKPVAKVVAKFIDFLHQESGVSFENIHVIGFSMGAHVAGIAGKHLQHGKLPVIYGLDPALPFFRYESSAERLDVQDANYVEVIHTSVGSYGYDHPLGHVDFYVNFGYNQPGCFFNECSHFRAFKLFAQTLRNERLTGRGCSRAFWWHMIQHKRCEKRIGKRLRMGVEGLTSQQLALRRGIYYVRTNAEAPFKIT